jgi:hypothetical protein
MKLGDLWVQRGGGASPNSEATAEAERYYSARLRRSLPSWGSRRRPVGPRGRQASWRSPPRAGSQSGGEACGKKRATSRAPSKSTIPASSPSRPPSKSPASSHKPPHRTAIPLNRKSASSCSGASSPVRNCTDSEAGPARGGDRHEAWRPLGPTGRRREPQLGSGLEAGIVDFDGAREVARFFPQASPPDCDPAQS